MPDKAQNGSTFPLLFVKIIIPIEENLRYLSNCIAAVVLHHKDLKIKTLLRKKVKLNLFFLILKIMS